MAVHDIIPSSNILAIDVRDTLGLSSNNLLDYCKSPNVNKWSRCKPIFFQINGEQLTTEADHGKVTGFAMTGNVFEHIPILDYKLPDPGRTDVPYRLHDFVGYKHRASKMRVGGGSISIGGGQSTSLKFQLWTGEMSIANLTGGGSHGNCNAICIVEKVTGGHRVAAFRYLSLDEMTSTAPRYYTIEIPYEAWNPPYDTAVKANYYLAFGNGESEPGAGGVVQRPIARYVIGDVESDDVRAEFTITITAKPDVTNPNQWKRYSYSEVESVGITLGKEVLWDEFKTWTHRNDGRDLTKLYINNIRGAWGRGVRLEYYNGTNWILLANFSTTTAYYEKDILIENVTKFRIVQSDF